MGAITWHEKYGLQMVWAKATVLASGGAGMLYRETTNPPQATADGLAMAYCAVHRSPTWHSCSSTPPRFICRVHRVA